jgi:HSP20 family protein
MTVRRNCYTNTDPLFLSIVPSLEQVFEAVADSTAASGKEAKGLKGRFPLVDVIETNDAFIVKLDIPGVHKDQLSLHFNEQGDLVIAGGKTCPDKEDATKKYLVKERRAVGEFERHIKLGKDLIDQDSVQAKLNDGVLEVTVRRLTPSKKTIAIN